MVDGAVFFRKNDFEKQEKIVLEIEEGKVTRITAYDNKSDELLQEYLKMTSESMADARNIQLAEIAIGFFSAATISDCFMEAEAAINTCHFCFGNNVCYGGKNASEFHGNSVLIRNPKFVEIS